MNKLSERIIAKITEKENEAKEKMLKSFRELMDEEDYIRAEKLVKIMKKTDSDAIYDIATGVLSMIHGRYTDDDEFDLVIMTLEAML